MFKIGSIPISNKIILAPLAGYSDLPFRMLCREYGAGLCVSEMISCHGLVYKQKKTMAMLQTTPEESPVSFQLFGADPEIMGEAAYLLNVFSPDIIDINMGCPVKKVTKRGAGAALMTNISKSEEIVKSVVLNCNCPVTIKIRSGPDQTTINAEEFARMAEDNGISAVTIHGRTWKQAFSGFSDWQIISRVKKAVSIPIIGNGDIVRTEDAHTRMKESGCDAVMIGRAALGNPWIFTPDDKPNSPSFISAVILKHLKLIEQFSDNPSRNIGSLKNHLGKYFKGFSGSSILRRKVYSISDWTELKQFISSIAKESTN